MRRITVLAFGLMLICAGASLAASTGTFRGKTSQHLSITIVIRNQGGFGPTVSSVSYRADFRCRNGGEHRNVADSWQPFAQLKRGGFSYSWSGAKRTSFSLHGRIRGNVVAGSFTDGFLIGCTTGRVTFRVRTR